MARHPDVTNYRGNQQPPPDNATHLAEELINFCARFETVEGDAGHPPPLDAGPLTLQTHKVRRIFSSVNVKKAGGPDGIPGRVIRDCTHQLAEVITDIFNQSLSQATVPTSLKSATIIPMPTE